MFRNLRLNIFIYYFVTVAIFLGILHFILTNIEIVNIYFVAIIMLGFVSFSGILISNLAIDPLSEYVTNLRNLSKETLHELNLPISTITSNVQMLKKNIEDGKSLKRLQRVEQACSMLQQRYNELDYLIKKQSYQELKESLNLKNLVNNRIGFLQSLYPKIEFILSLDDTIITNDKIGLGKVIDNIVDNAVKYSQNSNRINIELKNNQLSITDYGCGMDEFELLQIFDNYYQSNKEMQGFGIGLSLVKRFCDKQGIELNIHSKPDVGTTVTLKFSKEKN